MTNITLTSPVFYKKGQAGVSAVVGYESSSNRVARYSFTAPAGGATAVSLAFSGNWTGRGEKPKLAFFIGTDPESHANAGKDSPITGALTLQPDYYSYAGSAQILLLPGVTYYVWVFPTTAVFGWLQWGYDAGDAVATLTGAAISHISAQDGTLGEEMIINITRYGDYTHTVTCAFGAETITLCEHSVETQLRWTPPLELAMQLPNEAAGQAVFTVQTEDLGAMQCAVTLAVPESLAPTVEFTWENSCPAGLYRFLSALTVEVEAQAHYGATIRSTAVTLDGRPYSGAPLHSAGHHLLEVSATDSRGMTASRSEILLVKYYDRPQLTLSGSRCDADGTPNDMGEFARLTAQATVFIGPATLNLAGQTVEGDSFTCIVPAPSVSSPLFTATVTDGVGGTQTAEFRLAIGYATLDFLAGGKGIAFGTTATREGFVCAMPALFTGGVEGADRWQEEDGCLYRTVDGQKEWLSPPLLADVEYRTVERFKGKPVYYRLCTCDGMVPTAGSNNWFYDKFFGATEVLECRAHGYNEDSGMYCTFPTHDRDGQGIAAWAYHDGRIVLASSYAVGYRIAWVLVKYVK